MWSSQRVPQMRVCLLDLDWNVEKKLRVLQLPNSLVCLFFCIVQAICSSEYWLILCIYSDMYVFAGMLTHKCNVSCGFVWWIHQPCHITHQWHLSLSHMLGAPPPSEPFQVRQQVFLPSLQMLVRAATRAIFASSHTSSESFVQYRDCFW